jgi:phosphoglycerate dehydrogenase-like enzyme
MNIVVAHISSFSQWNAPSWVGERLQREFPQHSVKQLTSYRELEAELAGMDVFVGMSLRPEQFRGAERLRWIHSPAAAVHQLMFPELVESEVVVTNAASVHGPIVAEHALTLVMALAKGLHLAARFQHQHHWAKEQMWDEDERRRPRELAGATLLVIGLGNIGTHLARSARKLGMIVVATREHPELGGEADEVRRSSEIRELLPRADFVAVAAPVTKETKALLDGEAFARMKPSAYVVNVSRGDLVDEAALASALRERRIAGAALDVFVEEPLPQDSPLWDLENLLITPHTAGLTDKMWERHYALIAENLRRFDGGEQLLGSVDKQRGY